MSATAETIALLKSIDATLRELLALSKSKKRADVTTVASDADLDGPHGNPSIKAKDPRDWTQESMLGKRLSECPATYLDLLADRFDYFASKETDEKKQRYAQLDAKRARGWAARVRAKHPATIVSHTPAQSVEGFPSDSLTSDDLNF